MGRVCSSATPALMALKWRLQRLNEGSTAINYKKYVKTLIKSAWNEMPEKISITDKVEYCAVVLQKYSGEYSLSFSVDHFREKLKRFAFPHVVFHEVSHVWDFLKHGRGVIRSRSPVPPSRTAWRARVYRPIACSVP